jgi:BMFP domain-containing protein YqiC
MAKRTKKTTTRAQDAMLANTRTLLTKLSSFVRQWSARDQALETRIAALERRVATMPEALISQPPPGPE